MERDDKINIIKHELFELKSYINENDKNDEMYGWTSGNKNYYIKKTFLGDDMEILIGVITLRGDSCRVIDKFHTYIYKIPYYKGLMDFVDIEGYKCFFV